MTGLKLTASFNPGESVASLCSRTAALNGIRDVRTFASHFEFNFNGLLRGDPADVRTFADLVEIDPIDLSPGIAFPYGGLHEIRGERVVLSNTKGLRICPHCIADDEMTRAGRRGSRAFARTSWLISASRTCAVHSTAIVTSDTRPTTRQGHDFAALLRLDRGKMDALRAISVPASRDSLDAYIGERLTGAKLTGIWPDRLALHVVTRVAEQVGKIVRHGVDVTFASLDERERSACAGEGFTVLAGGVLKFQAFLRTLHPPYFKSKYSVGGNTLYGNLYKMLRQEQADPAFAPVIKLVRETAIDFLPLGRGDEFFGPVKTRRWHSIITASKEFAIHPTLVQKVLTGSGLVSADSASLAYDKILIEADLATRCLSEFAGALTATEAAQRLNIPQENFRLLVRAGLLEGLGLQDHNPAIHERYDVGEVDRFIQRMRALVTVDADREMVSISRARRVTGCRTDQIHDLLFGGKLRKVAMAATERGYLSFRVNVSEILDHTRVLNVGLISVREAERKLRQQAATVRALIYTGHLKVVRFKNGRGRFQNFVDPAEVERFKDEYVTLPQLARQRALPRRFVKTCLELRKIPTVLKPAEIGATLYRTADIPNDL